MREIDNVGEKTRERERGSKKKKKKKEKKTPERKNFLVFKKKKNENKLQKFSPPPFSQYISLLPSSLLFFTPFRIPKRKEEQKTSTNIHILRGLFHSLLL